MLLTLILLQWKTDTEVEAEMRLNDEECGSESELASTKAISDFAAVKVLAQKEVEEEPKLETFVSTIIKAEDNSKRKKHRRYTAQQIADFITNIIEGMAVKKAAEATGITERIAYHYKKQWNEYGTMTRNKRGGKAETVSPLKEEHSLYLVKTCRQKCRDNNFCIALQTFRRFSSSFSNEVIRLQAYEIQMCFQLQTIRETE